MTATQWKVDATKVLTMREIQTVLAELKRKAKRSTNTHQNLILFRLATCCGLRVSELLGLKLKNIHLDGPRPYIQIPKTIAKGAKSRRVPLWWDLGTLADIKDWMAIRRHQKASQDDLYLCSQSTNSFGKAIDRRNGRLRYLAATKILGRSITIHHGRHSFVSHSLNGGRSLAEVRDAAGHSNISTTSIYTHVITDESEEVGDLFAGV